MNKLPHWMRDPVEYNRTIEKYALVGLIEAVKRNDDKRIILLAHVARKAHRRMRYYRKFFRIGNQGK